ncbi:heme/hemin ABC transporter substrate-binding protein [Bartonella sp. A05]|uniref:heme/hemin ABC transporter substrate-binding protein n=1 Tax=Bartonella sp. A05 TaxID=2967261 RepID=UPI0022A8E218|nr:ABC transporter substrate-binding protein [Bartonella sp. A05]MCZ2203828.1 ABC transporter substrate-binding protein [Bartonella sp. A05]
MFASLLHRLSSFSLICALLFCTCCFQQAIAEQTTCFSKNARIVSIGGALTEIVYALGAQDQLIARDSTSMYPQEALKLPVLGYMRALSPEGVLSLSPECILLIEGSGPHSTVDILRKTSIPMVFVPEDFSRENVIEKIRFVGKALGREEQAAVLIEKVNQSFIDNDALLAKVTKPKSVLFVMSIQNGRVMASGIGTAANGMIELAGGINAISNFKGYKLLNNEALLNANPDVILLMDYRGNSEKMDQLLAVPAIKATAAAKNHAIKQVDIMYLLGFGPRTADAAKDMIRMLYYTDETVNVEKDDR